MKPVELIERALRNSSKAGDIVVDLFGGSGSSLIVQRWEKYTGKSATLEGDDITFKETAAERKSDAV